MHNVTSVTGGMGKEACCKKIHTDNRNIRGLGVVEKGGGNGGCTLVVGILR